jgi:hypothetical protein
MDEIKLEMAEFAVDVNELTEYVEGKDFDNAIQVLKKEHFEESRI